MEEWCGWPKTPSKNLEDRIHTVLINLLDGPSESSGEIKEGLVLTLEDGLQRADISLLSNGAQILGNKRSPQLTKRVNRSPREFVEPGQGGPLQVGWEHFA